MKKTLFIVLLASASFVCAQSTIPIQIAYDAAGNRVVRKVMQVSCMAPSNKPSDSTYYIDQLHTVQLKAYPNPTLGKVYVEAQGSSEEMDYSLRLFDSSGRKLHEANGSGCQMEIDLSVYPQGYYIVELNASGEQTTWKIIKK